MDVYRSSPSLLGIFHPFHLLPSAHAPPKPNPEDSPEMEDYINSSDSEFGRAEAAGSAREEGGRERSPSPSDNAWADVPKAPRSASRKRRASSQPGDSK